MTYIRSTRAVLRALRHHPRYGTSTGKVFFVDSGNTLATDDDGNSGTDPRYPMASLAEAVSRCADGDGDVIVVMPGHAETTTAIDVDVAGVGILGVGFGRNRPAFTATTAASDLLDITAANVSIENVRLIGAASGVTALLNVDAADCSAKDIVFEYGAAPVVAVTVTPNGHRPHFDGCYWRGTSAGPDVAIDFEGTDGGSGNEPLVENCTFNYMGSSGIDLGVIRGNATYVPGGVFRNITMVGVDTLAFDFNSSSVAVGEGLVHDVHIVTSAGINSVDSLLDVGGYSFSNVYATDAATARGTLIPTATAP